MGQTGRKLSKRYKEHVRSMMCNQPDSKNAAPVINNRHLFGRNGAVMKKSHYIDRIKN
jgi:hypothetical protein